MIEAPVYAKFYESGYICNMIFIKIIIKMKLEIFDDLRKREISGKKKV